MMSIEALAYIENLLKSIGIPYELMRWNKNGWPDEGYYFTGDYIEHESQTWEENGHQESTFILRGYTRGSWMLLEEAKAKIKKHISKTAILPNGNGIAIFYGSTTQVPTGDMALKSIKINLSVQEWSVE
jgi:hypothetical protein